MEQELLTELQRRLIDARRQGDYETAKELEQEIYNIKQGEYNE